MDLPPDLLLRVPEEAVRRVALAQVDGLRRAAARLGDPGDGAALHDVRVALRRLRSTLTAWKPLLEGSVKRKDRAALRRAQRASGAGRDAEVGARWTADLASGLAPPQQKGPAWLEERLRGEAGSERSVLAREVAPRLAKLAARLGRRLARYPVAVGDAAPPTPRRFAASLAEALAVRWQRFGEAWARVTGPDPVAAAHAARIEGKRLRYLLEPLSGLLAGADAAVERLRVVQDDLGAIQDLVVLQGLVREGLEHSAVAHARRLHRDAGARGPRGREPRDQRRAGLLALARAVEAARASRFAAVVAHGGASPALDDVRAAVEGVLRGAQQAAHEGLEIERKFLLSGLPAARPPGEVLDVEQGWLPGERLQERVRRVRRGDEVGCWRTLKAGRGLTRVEIEEPCPPALFASLWPLTAGLRVHKRRHLVPDGTHVWELDEFLDRDLVLAEVELASADEVVTLPGWLAPFVVRDVTEEEEYVNRNLAR